jgi:hypothetical protein
MAKVLIQIAKEVMASYEFDTDDDAAVAQQVEEEKLKSYEYEKSLNLEWDFDTWIPHVIHAYRTDEAA